MQDRWEDEWMSRVAEQAQCQGVWGRPTRLTGQGERGVCTERWMTEYDSLSSNKISMEMLRNGARMNGVWVNDGYIKLLFQFQADPDHPFPHLQASAKNGGSTGASAAKGGGGGSGASAAKQPPCFPLSPEEFEALVVRLEGLMQEAVSQESVGWQANGELTGWC